MQKTKTKKAKRTKVSSVGRGRKKQRCGNINTSSRKPSVSNIKKSSVDSKSDCLIELYNGTDFVDLIQIYEANVNKLDIDNIFWIMVNNKNKKFLARLFNRYSGSFTMSQLGRLRDNQNISLKMIMQQAKRRMQ